AYGLVNAVVPDEELEQTAFSAAGKLAAQPPNAVQVTKALLKKHSEASLKSALHEEIHTFASLLQGPEAGEAIRAFTEKRPPDFSKF
ncbi:MAG: enoyl-CoA hydratase, partial [Calditrichaeota bacterium]